MWQEMYTCITETERKLLRQALQVKRVVWCGAVYVYLLDNVICELKSLTLQHGCEVQ